MEYWLKKATIDDFEELYRIKVDSIKPYVEQVWGWNESFQWEFLKKNTPIEQVRLIMVAEENVAGFVQLTENEQEIFIGSLFLTSGFQSKGIGGALLQHYFNTGKTVRLEVLKINVGAIKFYKKYGMSVEGEDELKYKMIKQKKNDHFR